MAYYIVNLRQSFNWSVYSQELDLLLVSEPLAYMLWIVPDFANKSNIGYEVPIGNLFNWLNQHISNFLVPIPSNQTIGQAPYSASGVAVLVTDHEALQKSPRNNCLQSSHFAIHQLNQQP